MSGIAGIIHFDGRPVEAGQIESMTAVMDFRGPDGIHHWQLGNVAFGQCMLRTTPESLEEVQPLTNEDGSLVLVMDGRLDNWEELRALLLRRGANLRTRADAELVLRAYEVWGEDALREIDGDFALAIWDARLRKVFCARDRFGNKPFHYSWDGNTLAFATDLRAVLDLPWVSKQPDWDTVAEYLAADWVSLDTTLWSDIKRLRAAHALSIAGPASSRIHRYWQPDLKARLPGKTDQDHIEHYRELLFDTVRRTSRSHRPLAMEVSGGLDSSALYAVAMSLLRQGKLPAPDVRGYTLDFSGVAEADELQYVDAVSAHLSTVIERVAPSYLPLAWYGERAERFSDFPDYPNGAMGLGIAERAGAAGCRALVSGTGGDEWTGGSSLYLAEALADADWRELARLLASDIRELGAARALSQLLRRGLLPQLPSHVLVALRRWRDRLHRKPAGWDPFWLSTAMRERLQRRKAAGSMSEPEPVYLGQRRQLDLLEQPYWQSAKGCNDRRTAQHALDWRQPYWSRSIVEAAFASPDALYNRSGTTRWLHRAAMRDLLPPQVLSRQSKAEFSATFRRNWGDVVAALQKQAKLQEVLGVSTSGILRLAQRSFTAKRVGWDHGPPWICLCLGHALTRHLTPRFG